MRAWPTIGTVNPQGVGAAKAERRRRALRALGGENGRAGRGKGTESVRQAWARLTGGDERGTGSERHDGSEAGRKMRARLTNGRGAGGCELSWRGRARQRERIRWPE